MNRKDKFLRAIQLVESRRSHNTPLAFRLALNLKKKTIPHEIEPAAKKFVIRISL
jgi:hypothetical protein